MNSPQWQNLSWEITRRKYKRHTLKYKKMAPYHKVNSSNNYIAHAYIISSSHLVFISPQKIQLNTRKKQCLHPGMVTICISLRSEKKLWCIKGERKHTYINNTKKKKTPFCRYFQRLWKGEQEVLTGERHVFSDRNLLSCLNFESCKWTP